MTHHKKQFFVFLLIFLLIIPLLTSAEQAVTLPETSANLLFAGDVMCLAAQLSAAKMGDGWDFDYTLSKIAPFLKGADFSVGNLETPIAGAEHGVTAFDQEGSPILNAPTSFARMLSLSGFDMLVTANNHTFDMGDYGVNNTIRLLNERGIYHTGTYTSPYMQENTPVVRVNDIAIGVLAYSQYINQDAARYRASNNQYKLNLLEIEKVREDIIELRARGAEFIVVYAHWGIENTHALSDFQREMAVELAAAGADAIIGSHPHAVQAVDFVTTSQNGKEKEVLVAYSLGNLVSSMPRDMNNDSMLLNLYIERDGAGQVSLKEATYLCTSTRSVGGKSYGVVPSRLAKKEGYDAASLQASIDRTCYAVGSKIKEVDTFPYWED
ncbi:MAG: CapA family protein [Christensenellaceae bacterium]|jgi:poly-gamma-glutamate capsule biosynthesis protein CapA/YwtB (metallophosphatase superfamily)